MNVPPDYFEQMYAGSEDPWGFTSRWYEQRKRALTLAALPDPGYGHILEIGCSIGILSTDLVSRCEKLTCVEGDPTALAQAWQRLPESVSLVQAWLPDGWPAGRYDLVVLSEVCYYLDVPTLTALLDLVERDLTPGGTVVACHWRHFVEGYTQTGDAVHEAMNARWPRLSRVEEEDFLLDVLVPGGGPSVARRTRLLP